MGEISQKRGRCQRTIDRAGNLGIGDKEKEVAADKRNTT
jgi:hypothetical protein